MIREYYDKICRGEDVRANLIALRECLGKEKNVRAFAYLLGGDFDVLVKLLQAEDPKIRKNAALILGKMESEDLLPVLFDAYKREETLFVRADYLKAVSKMDYRPILCGLEQRLEELRSYEASAEEEKHIAKERRMLQEMVMKYRRTRRHSFTGYNVPSELILVTNRCQREATAVQIQGHRIALLSGGLRIHSATVEEIRQIRTWSELLFPIQTKILPVNEPSQTGKNLALPVLEKTRRMHEGDTPFLFRIEMRTKLAPEKKGAFIRKISDAIEQESGGMLINSVSDYELEIRLLERRDGTFAPMVKFFTISDNRFAYRRESVAASVSPVNAALAACLARPYLKEKAQVLDPFCGVGTMLIERHRAVNTGVMYGIDIFGDAIRSAHVNTELSGCRVYYINKDFFEFEHEYLFDEIFTDMPQATASKSEAELSLLYERFFEKASTLLKKNAVIVMYTAQPDLVRREVKRYADYRIAESYILNEKNNTTVFVICRGKL